MTDCEVHVAGVWISVSSGPEKKKMVPLYMIQRNVLDADSVYQSALSRQQSCRREHKDPALLPVQTGSESGGTDACDVEYHTSSIDNMSVWHNETMWQ